MLRKMVLNGLLNPKLRLKNCKQTTFICQYVFSLAATCNHTYDIRKRTRFLEHYKVQNEGEIVPNAEGITSNIARQLHSKFNAFTLSSGDLDPLFAGQKGFFSQQKRNIYSFDDNKCGKTEGNVSTDRDDMGQGDNIQILGSKIPNKKFTELGSEDLSDTFNKSFESVNMVNGVELGDLEENIESKEFDGNFVNSTTMEEKFMNDQKPNTSVLQGEISNLENLDLIENEKNIETVEEDETCEVENENLVDKEEPVESSRNSMSKSEEEFNKPEKDTNVEFSNSHDNPKIKQIENEENFSYSKKAKKFFIFGLKLLVALIAAAKLRVRFNYGKKTLEDILPSIPAQYLPKSVQILLDPKKGNGLRISYQLIGGTTLLNSSQKSSGKRNSFANKPVDNVKGKLPQIRIDRQNLLCGKSVHEYIPIAILNLGGTSTATLGIKYNQIAKSSTLSKQIVQSNKSPSEFNSKVKSFITSFLDYVQFQCSFYIGALNVTLSSKVMQNNEPLVIAEGIERDLSSINLQDMFYSMDNENGDDNDSETGNGDYGSDDAGKYEGLEEKLTEELNEPEQEIIEPPENFADHGEDISETIPDEEHDIEPEETVASGTDDHSESKNFDKLEQVENTIDDPNVPDKPEDIYNDPEYQEHLKPYFDPVQQRYFDPIKNEYLDADYDPNNPEKNVQDVDTSGSGIGGLLKKALTPGFLIPAAAIAAGIAATKLRRRRDGLRQGLGDYLPAASPRYIPRDRQQIVSQKGSNGLQISYRFTRSTHVKSSQMSAVELTFRNDGDQEIRNIHIGSMQLPPGSQLNSFHPIDVLPPGGTSTAIVGIQFNESAEPVGFDIVSTAGRTTVQIPAAVGDTSQAVVMNEGLFIKEKNRLKGTYEQYAKVNVNPNRINIDDVVYKTANVKAVLSRHGNILRYAGRLLSDGSLLLITILKGRRQMKIAVNSENKMAASRVLQDLKRNFQY